MIAQFPAASKGQVIVRVAALAGVCLLGLAGCRSEPDPQDAHPAASTKTYPVRLTVVDDKPLADMVERQWKARSEQPLVVRMIEASRLNEIKQLSADLVIYPSACLGTLAERNLIAPIDDASLSSDPFTQSDVFELQRLAEVRWGEQIYAVSLGSPQLVFMARTDLMDRQGLNVPRTGSNYRRIAGQLSRSALGSEVVAADADWWPVVEPLAGRWAADMLLARAAAYAQHPSQFSFVFDSADMQPLIDGPPFVRALTELVESAKLGPPPGTWLTPTEAIQTVLHGQAAMAITWPGRTASQASDPSSDSSTGPAMDDGKIGFFALPGAESSYNFDEQVWTPRDTNASISVPLIGFAGRLISIGKNARRPRDAINLLAILSGKEWSSEISPASAGTTLFRHSQLSKANRWIGEGVPEAAIGQYADLVAHLQSQPVHVTALRLPGADEYRATLATAVRDAVETGRDPAEILKQVAEKWNTITDRLGRDAQQAAYSRSLGMEP